MKSVPYASAIESLTYAMFCTILDICYAVSMVSIYQSNHVPKHWTMVKHIFKFLRRTRDYMLTYGGSNLILVGYTYSNFVLDMDSRKSTFGYVFTLGGVTFSWRSMKQQFIADLTTEVEYVANTKVAKEAIWLKKIISELDVVLQAQIFIILYCDNNGVVA